MLFSHGEQHASRSRTTRHWNAGHTLTSIAGGLALIGGLALVNPSGSAAASAVNSTAHDSFNRTLKGSWGSAATGGKYVQPLGAGRASVRKGEGVMALRRGTAAQTTLTSVQALDTTVQVKVRIASLPRKGNGVYMGPMARVSKKSGYRLSARVAPGRKLELMIERVGGRPTVVLLARKIVKISVKRQRFVNLRLDVVGSKPVVLRATAWPSGKSAPLAQLKVSDRSKVRIARAGSAALWGYVSKKSSSNTISFDNLVVNGTRPVTASAPMPTPTPTPTPTPPSVETGSAGAVPVGQADYPVPESAIFVAPTGSDSSSGGVDNPLRTISRAVAVAKSGTTIVLRAGTYHESVMVTKDKTLTIQSYPREAVWLDGSSAVVGFVKSGSVWVKNDWNVQFDSSPTYARGKADGDQPGWKWVDPNYPMAAHPDQVWIDGQALTQVADLAKVKQGTFFVDYAAKQLYVGSSPVDRTVRASDLVLGMTILSPRSTLRGFGVRRYAPSVPDFGALRLFDADGSTLENIVVVDNATLGIEVAAKQVRLNKVTSSRNGLMGLGSNYADGLVATALRVEGNNSERFNGAPVAGGYKLTRSRHVSISQSVFSGNVGTGLWFDESSYDVTVAGNDMSNNSENGLLLELSASITVVNNVMAGSGDSGILVLDSNNLRIWNNSVRGGLLPVRIADGPRVATNLSAAGHDPRQSLPDPNVTWITKDVEFKNNVVGDAKQGDNGSNWCGIVCVLDDRRQATAAQMDARMDGNLYYRASMTALPSFTVRWAGGTQGALNFRSIADFRRAAGQEAHGAEQVGTEGIAANGALASDGVGVDVGVPIPADVALTGDLVPGAQTVGPLR